MDKLELLLYGVSDSYSDFVSRVKICARDNPNRLDDIIQYIKGNPEATTSDILKWIWTEIDGIDLNNPPKLILTDDDEERLSYENRGREDYVVAVDFDGTLCKSQYPECGEPISENVQRVRELKRQGATIILWTCREGEALAKAVRWCEEHGVPVDYINENAPSRIARYRNDCRKISADLYIDDKAN